MENKNKLGQTTPEKKEKTAEQILAESVKEIFTGNPKLKSLLVCSDGQAFLESNVLYAKRHQILKKLKLYKITKDLSVELIDESDKD